MGEETKLVPPEPESLAPVGPIPSPPHYSVWEQAPEGPHLRDYLIILRKHQWLILSFLLTVVTVVTIASFKMEPVYEAVARVEIDREDPYILPFQVTAPHEPYWDMESYIETRASILQSESLALETIESLDLAKHPEFASESRKGDTAASTPGKQAVQEKPAILDEFLDRLSVRRARNSQLLEVHFESRDSKLAARIANTHVANFIEHNFRTRYESTVQASRWLATQLDELKIKVEKSEDALVAYERENQIWAIDEKQNITTQKLADLNREVTLAQADRMRKESDYRLARSGNVDAIPAVRDSQVIHDLLKRYAELNDRYTQARAQFGPNYPKVLRLETRLKELTQLLAQEKRNILDRIESEYRAGLRRETLLSQALEKQKGEVNELGQKLVQYNILKRESETNKQLYEGLLQRIKEAGISAGLRSSNIRVIDKALIPSEPIRPRKALNILLATFAGLIGGVGLAFLREYMDNTVKTPDDVEYLTRLPSLALVADYASLNGRVRAGWAPKLLKGASPEMQKPLVELIAHQRPPSQISETYRALRTSLLLSQAEGPPQVILVTSAVPREGKTTAAVNLAVTFAQLGDPTLLLDADMRKDMRKEKKGKAAHSSDGQPAGLSSYLTGTSPLEEVVMTHPLIANLAVIPAGPIPPNPAELLSSERLREGVDSVRGDYKFIVVDSPPVLSVTDPVILSVLADGVLLVVRSSKTPKEALGRAKDLLGGVKCRLLGVILNAVDFAAPGYYSYKYYPYSYSGQKDRSG